MYNNSIYLFILAICLVYVCGDDTFCKYPNLAQYNSPHNRPNIILQDYTNDCIIKRDYSAYIEDSKLYIKDCPNQPKYRIGGQENYQDYIEPVHCASSFAHVTCGYDDPLFIIAPADIPRKIQQDAPFNPDKKNIFVFMLDAVSREALHRYMPKTVQYLKDQEGFSAHEFIKYATVGLNSNPNKFQLFGRHDYDKVLLEGQTNLSWIWDHAKEQGYLNLVGEDGCPHSSFVWDLLGITNDPDSTIDYTLLNQFCSQTPSIKNSHCLAGKWAFEYQIEYFTKALKDIEKSGSKQPVFVYSNLVECHEPIQYGAGLMDNAVVNYIQSIMDSSFMDNGVIVFLSDHGLHFGDYGYSSVLGMAENKHPFLYMLTKEKTNNKASINYNRLITPSDVYKTMVSFLGPKSTAPVTKFDFNILTEVVPADRNCEMAGIPAQFCLCTYGPTCDRAGIPDNVWSKCSAQFTHPFFFNWEYYAEQIMKPTFGGSFDECDATRHWCAYGISLGWNGTETFTIRDYVAQNEEIFNTGRFCWAWPLECNWINVVEHFFTAGHVDVVRH